MTTEPKHTANDSQRPRAMRVQLPSLINHSRSVAAVQYSDDECSVVGANVSPDRAKELAAFVDHIIAETQAATLRGVLVGLSQHPALGCWDRPFGGGEEEAAWIAKMLNGNYRAGDKRLPAIIAGVLRGLYGESIREHRTGEAANFASVLRRAADAMDAGADLRKAPLASGPIPSDH